MLVAGCFRAGHRAAHPVRAQVRPDRQPGARPDGRGHDRELLVRVGDSVRDGQPAVGRGQPGDLLGHCSSRRSARSARRSCNRTSERACCGWSSGSASSWPAGSCCAAANASERWPTSRTDLDRRGHVPGPAAAAGRLCRLRRGRSSAAGPAVGAGDAAVDPARRRSRPRRGPGRRRASGAGRGDRAPRPDRAAARHPLVAGSVAPGAGDRGRLPRGAGRCTRSR